uniref:Uncharacterized protein n=1 Tax=Arundo donax TaxID=35708 RepID=A0A0A9G3W7_ARUDO
MQDQLPLFVSFVVKMTALFLRRSFQQPDVLPDSMMAQPRSKFSD